MHGAAHPIDLFCDEMRDIIRRVREQIQPLIVLPGPYYMTDFTAGGERWSHADLDLFYRYNDAIKGVADASDLSCLLTYWDHTVTQIGSSTMTVYTQTTSDTASLRIRSLRC